MVQLGHLGVEIARKGVVDVHDPLDRGLAQFSPQCGEFLVVRKSAGKLHAMTQLLGTPTPAVGLREPLRPPISSIVKDTGQMLGNRYRAHPQDPLHDTMPRPLRDMARGTLATPCRHVRLRPDAPWPRKPPNRGASLLSSFPLHPSAPPPSPTPSPRPARTSRREPRLPHCIDGQGGRHPEP